MKKIKVAFAGNPNSGKSTIFNNLTGGRQKIANYPGVTVEKKTGTFCKDDYLIEVIDLPGTYGLTAYSPDEQITRDVILGEDADIIVNVIDASNLERNLYLTVQLMELNVPLILAFNMSDVAEQHGIKFDTKKLSEFFGAPIVRMVGRRNEGTTELISEIVNYAGSKFEKRFVSYRQEIEAEIKTIEELVKKNGLDSGKFTVGIGKNITPRWIGIKLLEEDTGIKSLIKNEEIICAVENSISRIQSLHNDSPAVLIADQRYGYISGACQEAVHNTAEIRHAVSDKIDTILTHHLFGIAIFLALMYCVFFATFKISEPFMKLLEWSFERLAYFVKTTWLSGHFSPLKSLITDGVIAGVGGVLVFLPNILLLFFGISLLEESGYMARAAFVLDRLMHKIGLHGKSFVPMVLGFGCTVPAVLATRILDSQRNRLITILVLPLMSCGARLAIYSLLIPAFFPPSMYAPVLWGIYIVGIILAIIGAKLLGKYVFPGETGGLVMELPPYRLPTFKSVLFQMWERTWLYLRKAATIILGVSVIMWTLSYYPRTKNIDPTLSPAEQRAEQIANSIAGKIGHALEPLLKPMGFDWRIGTALIGAVAAKEVVVAQLGVVMAIEDPEGNPQNIREVLRKNYSPVTGLSLLLFCLIGLPCAATIAAVRSETGSWKWALIQFFVLTLVAWLISTVVYQLGSLII